MKKAGKDVLINELPAAYEVLKQARKEVKMDRSGHCARQGRFRAFVDLILAGYPYTLRF